MDGDVGPLRTRGERSGRCLEMLRGRAGPERRGGASGGGPREAGPQAGQDPKGGGPAASGQTSRRDSNFSGAASQEGKPGGPGGWMGADPSPVPSVVAPCGGRNARICTQRARRFTARTR